MSHLKTKGQAFIKKLRDLVWICGGEQNADLLYFSFSLGGSDW